MDSWRPVSVLLLLAVQSACGNRRLYPDYALDRVIKPNTMCRNTAGLTSRQSLLCTQNPHSVDSAIQGMQIAIHECKVQFQNRRWNCSALETRNKIPQTSAFLRHANGNRESAFSFAIASAGVVHQVAHACSLGKINECKCRPTQLAHLTASQRKKLRKQIDQGKLDLNRQVKAFEKAGCNHNINFGMEFAVKFLDSQEERDIVSQIRSHNNRVGRLIVANNMKENCRCHGTSGACSMKTCWRQTPDFKAVGLKIMKKYNKAKKVSPNAIGNHARNSNDVTSRSGFEASNYNVEDLVYLDDSPLYCRENRRLNIAGTKGRICNHTAGENELNSCEHLCCNRGYKFHKIKRVEQCRCRFHWCCYVNCEQCESEETVAVCN